MAITQAQIDAFEQALIDRNGAIDFTYGDQSVRFETLEEARAHLAWMKQQLQASQQTVGRVRYAATSKGV